MKIYNGGSDKENLLKVFTGNALPPTTLLTANQMFISFTSNENGAGRGFLALFEFGKKFSDIIYSIAY